MNDTASLLRDAYLLAERESDDPVTKNGAILVNPENVIIAQGANRLPDKVRREPHRYDRPNKYDYIIHAEQNAIAHAARLGRATQRATMYCPWAACTSCARLIIQAGITKLVTHETLMMQTHEKWRQDINKAIEMLREAEVEVFEFPGTIGGVDHMFDKRLWKP